jgi:hypothetical protein
MTVEKKLERLRSMLGREMPSARSHVVHIEHAKFVKEGHPRGGVLLPFSMGGDLKSHYYYHVDPRDTHPVPLSVWRRSDSGFHHLVPKKRRPKVPGSPLKGE